jgi:hypothetical protein
MKSAPETHFGDSVFLLWYKSRVVGQWFVCVCLGGGFNPRVEAGSITSTIALRVIGSDEKGIQCLGI